MIQSAIRAVMGDSVLNLLIRLINTKDFHSRIVMMIEWNRIWKTKIQRQIKIAFMEDKGAITVRAKKAQMVEGMNLDENLCPLCNNKQETMEHLFLGCQFTRVM